MPNMRPLLNIVRAFAGALLIVVPAGCNSRQPAAAPDAPAATSAQAPAPAAAPASTDVLAITVYKDANCGCCKSWIDHLRQHGFTVTAHDVTDLDAVKARYHVGGDLAACHTAIVNGYVVEGHVPADLIKRMLSDKPRIAGIAVPGMPAGSPGMEVGFSERYDILSFDSTGRVTGVYARR